MTKHINQSTKLDKNLSMKQKLDYYDLILSSKELLAISQIAQDYGMTGENMNKLLHDKKIQFKRGNQWFLYKKFSSKGYAKSYTHTYPRSDGSIGINLLTKWTQKGKLFIYKLLKKDGILPLIEQENNKIS